MSASPNPLLGQLRDRHGQLQDLDTKGSGATPWSRGGDGRLTCAAAWASRTMR